MIYGIGSMYDSTEEQLDNFVSRKMICVGWEKSEAPGLHQLFAQIGVGDIVFVKSHPPSQGLYIKAVGIIDSADVYPLPDKTTGRSIIWSWVGKKPHRLGRINDRYDHFRGGTLYQELGPRVQSAVIDLLLHGDSAKTLQEPAE